MGDFLDVALGFPTGLFSFMLVVVVLYWLLVLLGAFDLDILGGGDVDVDADLGDGGGEGGAGVLAAIGLDGVPVTIVLSTMIPAAWFTSLAGDALVDGPAEVAVLPAALVVGYLAAVAVVRPLRRAFPAAGTAPTRADLVGRVATIRTTRVTERFGQAEVAAADGSTALVQVRVADEAAGRELTAGAAALLYGYDPEGEFFWAGPVSPDLDPRSPRR